MSEKIRVAGIVEDSITDGPGLRTTIFMQGCDKRCEGCHNPTAQPMEGGKEYTVSELFDIISYNPIISGITFSGGEPFLQAANLLPLAKLIKGNNLELAIYTGYDYEYLFKHEDMIDLLHLADIVVDGPFIKKLRNLDLKFKGSSNQRIIDVQKSLQQNAVILETSERWNKK
jgi:anaerobic ribonucleoside-triphosphate reductase activating protein